jgi:hypothetical protein
MVKLSRQPNPFLGPPKRQQLPAASAQSKTGKMYMFATIAKSFF